MRLIRTIGKWLDDRLQLGAPIRETMEHPIPRARPQAGLTFSAARR